jgi:hypothetical protein
MTETPIDEQFTGMPTVSVTRILRESGPRLVRDSLGPILSFYVGFKLVGLLLGITLACIVGIGLYVIETRSGRTGVLARLSLGFVLLQAAVGFGLIAYSTWYSVHGFRNSKEWGPLIAMVETERLAASTPPGTSAQRQ